MDNPETISEAFIEWMEDMSIGTFGTNIYLSQLPENAPNEAYWVVTSGGDVIRRLATGEKVKQYFVTVNYRSTSGKSVERDLFSLENLVDTPGCLTLTGFEVLDISSAQFPSDADLDSEDRRVGLMQVNIQTYKKGLNNGIS